MLVIFHLLPRRRVSHNARMARLVRVWWRRRKPLLSVQHLSNRSTRQFALGLHRHRRFCSFESSVGRNEDNVVSRHDQAEQNNNDCEYRQDESSNHHRIVSQSVEFREREAKDDGEDRSTEVPQKERHKSWYLPVLALANDNIKVSS